MTHNFSHSNWHVKKKRIARERMAHTHKKKKNYNPSEMKNIAYCFNSIHHQIVWPMEYFISVGSIIDSTDFQLAFAKNYIREIALWLDLLLLFLFFVFFIWNSSLTSCQALALSCKCRKNRVNRLFKGFKLVNSEGYNTYIYSSVNLYREYIPISQKVCRWKKLLCKRAVGFHFGIPFFFLFLYSVIPCNKPNAIILGISQLVNCPQWSDRQKNNNRNQKKKMQWKYRAQTIPRNCKAAHTTQSQFTIHNTRKRKINQIVIERWYTSASTFHNIYLINRSESASV